MTAPIRSLFLSAAAVYLTVAPVSGQLSHRVDARNLYYRVYCRVPFVGKGTAEDPRRPKYAPAPSDKAALTAAKSRRSGILGWTMVESDDHQSAIVEFVAADRAALKEILADPDIQSFEKGASDAARIQTTFQQYRKDFNLRYFGVRLP